MMIPKNWKEIMDKASYPLGLKVRQQIVILFWLFFNKKKFNSFLENLNMGMSCYFAYRRVK